MRVRVVKEKRPVLKNGVSSFRIFSRDALWAYHPCVVEHRGSYYMFYTGKSLSGGIAHHVLLATSKNLRKWENCSKSPIIERGEGRAWDSGFLAHAFVFANKGKFLMLYDGSRCGDWLEEIGLAESSDLINWKKYRGNPIFKVGRNWWESRHVSRCCVYKEGRTYYLYYAGHDGERERIGVARGKSIFALERFLTSPVLDIGKRGEWDERSISDPRIIKYNGKYLMFYSGIDAKGIERIGFAESLDLISWQKNPKNPVLDVSKNSWDKVSAARADITKIGNSLYLFYSGKKRFLYNIGIARLSIW